MQVISESDERIPVEMTDMRGLDMLYDALGKKIFNGGVAFGMGINDVYSVDVAAHMGFDWFLIDHMFSPTDWSETDRLIRAGWAAGITPVLRVQSNPWIGYDPRIAVDVTRALGIGAQYVLVSNSGKREIEDCVNVAGDWHRKATWVHPFDRLEDWEPRREQLISKTQIIPQPESEGALADLLETLDIPQVRVVFIGMSDASRVLSGTEQPNWYSEKLWDLVDSAVAKANESGKVIGGNPSYAYEMDEFVKRTVRLIDHGVRMILLQGMPHMFQSSMKDFWGTIQNHVEERGLGKA